MKFSRLDARWERPLCVDLNTVQESIIQSYSKAYLLDKKGVLEKWLEASLSEETLLQAINK